MTRPARRCCIRARCALSVRPSDALRLRSGRATGCGTGVGGHLRDCESSATGDGCRGRWPTQGTVPAAADPRLDDRCGGSGAEPSSDPCSSPACSREPRTGSRFARAPKRARSRPARFPPRCRKSSTAHFELTPGLESRASCPEAIWASALYWHDYFGKAGERKVPFGRYVIGHKYPIVEPNAATQPPAPVEAEGPKGSTDRETKGKARKGAARGRRSAREGPA